MARGELQIIGATTFEEYKRLEKDSAFNRRVQKVICEEPTEAETVEILKGVKSSYEKHHNVSYSDEVISSVVSSATRYINDRFNPDRSFDVLDEAGATAAATGDKVVTEAHIEKAISAMTSVKKVVVETAETKPMLSKGLDEELAKTVYGQDEAIKSIQKAYRLYDSGLTDDDKPIASMLWVGPTGVGKTQLAESLAKATGAELIKLDMSEYQEKHAVAKLTGAPAGYVGYEDGSILVDAIRKHPNAVILFDEIEKAHPDVYNVLLQIMDKAQLTDNQGRKADFKNAAILMTSNCGVAEATAISKKPTLGFGTSSTVTSTMDKTIMDAVEKKFPPEFRNRLTQTVLFNQVDESMGKLIIDREMKKLNAKLVSKKLNITLEDTAIDEILKKGISIEFGAREIKRIIDKNIKELAVQLIIDEGRSGSINVGCIDGNFCVVE
jgi:ATP-dependent Clp protease ATP-binding subunit ClpA